MFDPRVVQGVPVDGSGIIRSGRSFDDALTAFYESQVATELRSLIYWPDARYEGTRTINWAHDLLRDAHDPPPYDLVPVMPVDDLSLACISRVPGLVSNLPVHRWHLGAIDPRFQGVLIDTDLFLYAESVRDELAQRAEGLRTIDRLARKYKATHVSKGVRPRGTVLRPVQLACQNVVIALAALRHDPTFDGLRVPVFLTGEVPHVATHEASRALAALILCDAFQNGGTMEIRFGEPRENMAIPPALARFARTADLQLGIDDPACITPAEARELFMAVTPMPDELRLRVNDLVDRGVVSPERICFVLMAGLWTAIEVDYIAATSGRVESILRGGAPFLSRTARQSELDTCRSASMIGMLHRVLSNSDSAGGSGVRVFEDGLCSTAWEINSDIGAVAFTSDRDLAVPWRATQSLKSADLDPRSVLCLPRSFVTSEDYATFSGLQEDFPNSAVAFVVPADSQELVAPEFRCLVCPERIAELDIAIERRLAALRVGRL